MAIAALIIEIGGADIGVFQQPRFDLALLDAVCPFLADAVVIIGEELFGLAA